MNQEQSQNADRNFDMRAIYGDDHYAKIRRLSIFIHGISGLGIEVAKNLILSSLRRVTICDDALITLSDLQRNLYLKASQVGNTTRAQGSLEALQSLNPNVKVDKAHSVDSPHILKDYDCVIILDHYGLDNIISCNKLCREHGVKFIYGGCLGLYGFIFNDFGQEFEILDCDGEEPYTLKIEHITNQPRGVVSILEYQTARNKLKDGDIVVFDEVVGMKEINGKSFKIQTQNSSKFCIGDTTNFSPYISGGAISLIKTKSVIKHQPFEQSLIQFKNQQTQINIGVNQADVQQMHLILYGIFQFYKLHKRIPENLSTTDADQLISLSKKLQGDVFGINKKISSMKLDENIVKNISLYCQTQISPVALFFGGMIAQEALKITGKFNPISQWLHHNFFEIVPQGNITRQIKSTKYDDYLTLFGDQFLNQTQRSKSLIAGSGGSCQLIKMLALMGVGSAEGGVVFHADHKLIRQQNLYIHSLFREQDQGKSASQVICETAMEINKDCSFKSIAQDLTQTTEVFNDDFWSSLQFVVCSFDNNKSELQLDNQCILYEKPLFQIGVNGTKGSAFSVVPFKTATLSDVPIQQFEYPLSDFSTIKNFPFEPQHAVQMAPQFFYEIFYKNWQKLANFYQDKVGFVKKEIKEAQDTYQRGFDLEYIGQGINDLKELYYFYQSKSFEKCVYLAIQYFYDFFYTRLAKLLESFPANRKIQDSNRLFWSGLKKVPKPIHFNIDDEIHFQFVQSTSKILASIIKITPPKQAKVLKELIASILQNKQIDFTTNTENKYKFKSNLKFEEQVAQIKREIQQLLDLQVSPQNSPKPLHVDLEHPQQLKLRFIIAASKIRARNYGIKEFDGDRIKMITFRMIPKTITTTCATVGALGIEIIKLFLNKNNSKPIPHRIFNCNLVFPLLVSSQPNPVVYTSDKEFDPIMMGPIKAFPSKFTKWHKIHVKGPMTLSELRQKIEQDYGIKICMITHKQACLYDQWSKNGQANVEKDVKEVVEKVTKRVIGNHKRTIILFLCSVGQNQVDVVLPDIKYYL